MKIGELSKLCGLSIDTLRFYEKIGLLEKPLRDNSGQRVYDNSILVWLEFLRRLRETDMPLKEQKIYTNLRAVGDDTTVERRKLLESHLTNLILKQQKLAENIDAMKAKIAIYRQKEVDIANDKNREN